MELKDFEYEKSVLKKKEIEERIKENQRLIDLLQNNGIREKEIVPIESFKTTFAVRKIQRRWKAFIMLKKLRKERLNKEKNKGIKPINEHTLKFIQTGGDLSYKDEHINNNDKNIIYNPYDISSILKNKRIMKHITNIQKKFRKRLKIKNETYLKHYYTREFERILLEPIRPEKCEAIRHQIIKFINAQNMEELKKKNLKLLLHEYVDKYLVFNIEFPYMVDLRSDNYKMLCKCLDQIAFLSVDQEFPSSISDSSNLQFFDKFYYELEDKDKARKDVDKKINDLEHKLHFKDFYVDDFEDRNVVAEIDAFYGFTDFFKDVIHSGGKEK